MFQSIRYKGFREGTINNLGAAYPNNLLTIVIFTKDKINFKDAPETMNADKNICVTGKLKEYVEYRGRPEIVVSSPDQIIIQ